MNTQEINAMSIKLMTLGIPCESLKVFGAVRCNVNVKTIGRESSEKWIMALSKIFPGAKVRQSKAMWEAKENKGTNLLPTVINGYLVSVSC